MTESQKRKPTTTMLKIDRMSSSLLCMVRGKLCMTIATAFTLTMATHLLLFMIFIDHQLLNSMAENTSGSNVKTRHLISKRHAAVMNYAEDEVENGNIQNDEKFIQRHLEELHKNQENKLQRKILEDSQVLLSGDEKVIQRSGSGLQTWFHTTFHGFKSKLFNQSKTRKQTSDEVRTENAQDQTKISAPEVLKTKRSSMATSLQKDSSNSKTLQKLPEYTDKKLDIQEVNIAPHKQDHEWEPLEDWNTEHLIVAEKKVSPKKIQSNSAKNTDTHKTNYKISQTDDKRHKTKPSEQKKTLLSKSISSNKNKANKNIILEPVKIEVVNYPHVKGTQDVKKNGTFLKTILKASSSSAWEHSKSNKTLKVNNNKTVHKKSPSVSKNNGRTVKNNTSKNEAHSASKHAGSNTKTKETVNKKYSSQLKKSDNNKSSK